jgi:hypothetical protein
MHHRPLAPRTSEESDTRSTTDFRRPCNPDIEQLYCSRDGVRHLEAHCCNPTRISAPGPGSLTSDSDGFPIAPREYVFARNPIHQEKT